MTNVLDPRAAEQEPWAGVALPSLLSSRSRGVSASDWMPRAPTDTISLNGGDPDPETLPFAQLLDATKRVLLSAEGSKALQYGGAAGYDGLRELVATTIDPQPGLGYTAANVALTSGSAQGFQNVFDTFLDPGDTVVIEAPTWGGIIRTLHGFGARIESVPLDEQGMRTDLLDQTLARLAAEGRQAKLIYTIPAIHNPTGVSMPLERRQQLLASAARHHVLVLEDDAYGAIRFGGEALPSLLTLSGGDGVIRCGTFSKMISTGIRVGWITAAQPYMEALTRMRFDSGASPFTTRIVAAYIDAGYHEPHVAAMRDVYRSKCDAVLNALEESCTKYATWTRPDGGYFLWLTLKSDAPLPAVLEAAHREGVHAAPGPSFFTGAGGETNLRIGFTCLPEAELVEGVRRLARAFARVAA